MTVSEDIAFWGTLVIANVWIAADNPLLGFVWIFFACAIYFVAKRRASEST